MSASKYIAGDKEAISSFIDKFDTFLFDCDGVLWSGDHLFENVAETLTMLRNKGKKLVFVTNNSTKSRADYAKKFTSFDIPVTAEEVFGSSYSAAIYISRILNLPAEKSTVFLVSESGTETEFTAESIKFIGGSDPSYRRPIDPPIDLPKIQSGELLDPTVGAVVLALDFNINYLKMALATAYVQRGAVLLATNSDPTLPYAGGLFPGAGSVGAGVLKATRKEPVVLGKPSQAMMDAIEGKFKLDRGRTCMVGDRLDTDVRFGNEGGLGGTLAVLTGVTERHEIEEAEGTMRPSVFVDKLGDLLIAE
ncbi:4-nitrophenylphosphatase [Microthyrium microscopicum]|uniref:4-nitrophenylphosphatase n=1 Tax=Microthyrium microscopicum TaxID=703497 RepID=A0A6A6UKM7_9PEZI|nr:4-nitrophenylphosphatase [Microthyrium microscopicum]